MATLTKENCKFEIIYGKFTKNNKEQQRTTKNNGSLFHSRPLYFTELFHVGRIY